MRSLIRPALVALAIFSSGAVAGCDDDAPPRADVEAVEAAVRTTIGHFNAADAEAFRTSFTERGFAQFVGEHWDVPAEFMSSNKRLSSGLAESSFQVASFENTRVGGGSGYTDVMRGGLANLVGDRLELRLEDGRWLVDGYDNSSVSPEVPDGYATTQVRLREFSIELPDALIAGRRAFKFTNDGDLEHDISLVWLADGVPTEGFFFGSFDVWGDEYLMNYGSIEVDPGATANLVPAEQLRHRDGRYVLICNIDAESGRSHGYRGMLDEFRLD